MTAGLVAGQFILYGAIKDGELSIVLSRRLCGRDEVTYCCLPLQLWELLMGSRYTRKKSRRFRRGFLKFA